MKTTLTLEKEGINLVFGTKSFILFLSIYSQNIKRELFSCSDSVICLISTAFFVCGSLQISTDRYDLQHLFLTIELDFYECFQQHGGTTFSLRLVCFYLQYCALILLKKCLCAQTEDCPQAMSFVDQVEGTLLFLLLVSSSLQL